MTLVKTAALAAVLVTGLAATAEADCSAKHVTADAGTKVQTPTADSGTTALPDKG